MKRHRDGDHIAARFVWGNAGRENGRGVLRSDGSTDRLWGRRVPGRDEVRAPFHPWLEGNDGVGQGEWLRLRRFHLRDASKDGFRCALSKTSSAVRQYLGLIEFARNTCVLRLLAGKVLFLAYERFEMMRVSRFVHSDRFLSSFVDPLYTSDNQEASDTP